MIETRDLVIGYDSDLVSDIALSVEPGKIVTLIGPNGSGKSTLLKTITGELAARGGVVMLDGKDRSDMQGKEAAKILSMVTTKSVSPELMTCREVTESGRYPYTGVFGRLSEEDERVVSRAMDITETTELADTLFSNISDGQRQRVMLARALCQEPKVLVLDEPTSFLDIRYRIDILSKIRKLTREQNIAVLMSLHEPQIAMQLSDTVVAMGDGRIQRIGTVDEVFEESFIRQLFKLEDEDVSLLGGSPFMVKEKAGRSDFLPGVIMVMGTMSGVGKSMIAAGMCRIFAQDGYRVAPFKSQNMALNSFVTDEGLEMGRAQVVQAECAGIRPVAAMNPILLKPVSDCGSQVIVNGNVVGNMKAAEYFEYKKGLVPVIMEAYESLRRDNDIIVVEGAGSAAEINLKDGDIVNMGLAGMLKAPVLVVGDIDRGGVFAQLLGTLDLLEDDERSRVVGLVINKFRGDKALLEPGLEMIRQRSKVPITGVVPYMELHLDDEDSLSERFDSTAVKAFDIAVIRLPHISNFTDLDVFSQVDDVSVRYITSPDGIGDCDIIVIPGTKNTTGDLGWLRQTGLFDAIIKYAKEGGVIIGICGGFQMLGRTILDPGGEESRGTASGLSLLPVDTLITQDKTRRSFEGTVTEPTGVLEGIAGTKIGGYEIHMGRTQPYEELAEFTSDGTGYCKGNIYGSYVHGLFDSASMAGGVIRSVAKMKGRSVDTGMIADRADQKEKQYDLLADVLRQNLDMESIYAAMSINVK